MERKLFRTGNSLTVTIPTAVAAELGLAAGATVDVAVDREHGGLLIKRVAPPPADDNPVTPEFAEWVDGFIDRYGDALRTLAKR
jgi:putative addiction module antidote